MPSSPFPLRKSWVCVHVCAWVRTLNLKAREQTKVSFFWCCLSFLLHIRVCFWHCISITTFHPSPPFLQSLSYILSHFLQIPCLIYTVIAHTYVHAYIFPDSLSPYNAIYMCLCRTYSFALETQLVCSSPERIPSPTPRFSQFLFRVENGPTHEASFVTVFCFWVFFRGFCMLVSLFHMVSLTDTGAHQIT